MVSRAHSLDAPFFLHEQAYDNKRKMIRVITVIGAAFAQTQVCIVFPLHHVLNCFLRIVDMLLATLFV